MGKLINFDGNRDLEGVDPRLIAIMMWAGERSPCDVKCIDGKRVGGKGNHKKGYAIDISLFDAQGKELPNTMFTPGTKGQKADSGKRVINPGAPEAFKYYELFALEARVYQRYVYPELDKVFRWGGGFEAGGTPFDMMHFDITPKGHGQTYYYTWKDGLSKTGKTRVPAIVSVRQSGEVYE